MSYQYFCEACVRASPLVVNKTTLNRMGRQRVKDEKAGIRYRVVSRFDDGKPLDIGYTRPDGVSVRTPAGCVCSCADNNHEPLVCTGTRDHIVGGRPGSGVLDKLADQLGAEPIPEMILGYGAQVEAMVYAVLFEFDLTEAERQSWRSGQLRITLNIHKAIVRLNKLVKRERPDLVDAEPSWSALQANLRLLAGYRNNMAHSWPVESFFQRVKWQEGIVTNILTSPKELATMIDLATQLISQLDFLPRYLGRQDRLDGGGA